MGAAIKRRASRNRKTSNKPPTLLEWAGMLKPGAAALVLLLAVALASGLSVVYTTHKNRFAFNELQQLKDQANQLQVEWGQLLIEQSTFGLEGRIEQKAIEALQMHVPEITNIVMVSHE
ncbi:MAG: cell division protein FtsL [Gammaproteobacteria bacterium]|jgi:cell division protein FtsL|nr:cell division protein FtsL [Gammaproteobacteria bacterium]|tara:strand:- start:233 stop:589 length:357 start_codon:yes stop_codon:yes gene_type:complete